MIRMSIPSWAGAAVIAGLVLANVPAVDAQTETQPPPAHPPAPGVPTAGTPPPAPAAHPVAPPAAAVPLDAATKPIPERLDGDQLANIEEELADLVEDNAGVSAALLRPRLTARAETLAAETLGITTKQLAQSAGIRRQLRAIVRALIEKIPPAPDKSKKTPSTPPDDDGQSHRRCECIYCHSLHAAGTCPLPYQPASLPTLPTQGSYAAAPYYVIPYAPRHHFLHGLLCPCAWCRGHW